MKVKMTVMMMMMLGSVLLGAHCSGMLDAGGSRDIEIQRNVTAVLGEDVFFSCRYTQDRNVSAAMWKRKNRSAFKRLTGFASGQPVNHDQRFSLPDSPANLTVRVRVSSLKMEGIYTCEFSVNEEDLVDTMFLSVQARPTVVIQVSEETVDGVHYQTASCSAVGGRPRPSVSWRLDRLFDPSDDSVTLTTNIVDHPNGTATASSSVRFPTHLLDQGNLTCRAQHPSLPEPKISTAMVQTYLAPNVSVGVEMQRLEGGEFWVVSCSASGGRPHARIALAFPVDEELQREDQRSADALVHLYYLPVATYEGRNVTCSFQHPKFSDDETRVVTLPSFYLSEVRALLLDVAGNGSESVELGETLELQEGQDGVAIELEVNGSVPRYAVSCGKDDGPLPEDVELLGGRRLVLPSPVWSGHAGLYRCVASYHRHQAALQINITVTPLPALQIPPTIRVDVQSRDGRRVIECSADDAIPAANVSWHVPEGVPATIRSNLTSRNGSYWARGLLLLPACSRGEFTVQCLINHPALESAESRTVTLVPCAQPNVTLSSSGGWRAARYVSAVNCSVSSSAPAATISWLAGGQDGVIGHLEEVGRSSAALADGTVTSCSSVELQSPERSGQNVTCVVEHPSLDAPERRSVFIPAPKAPELSVSLVRQQDSPLWLSVCDHAGHGVRTNLHWLLPENSSAPLPEYDDHEMTSRLTYRFPLSRHEGQNLTCVSRDERRTTQSKTIAVPRYHVSSVRVLNRTAPPLFPRQARQEAADSVVTLRKGEYWQKILLRVDSNAPDYNLTCQRRDGSSVPVEDAALVFPAALTQQDGGLYTCRASFYHLQAVLNLQVDVDGYDADAATVSLTAICWSFAAVGAVIIAVVVVTLWAIRRRSSRRRHKESPKALTGLMQEPSSPPPTTPPGLDEPHEEFAQLLSFSIVIDVKSAV